jgi:hypothetical protein
MPGQTGWETALGLLTEKLSSINTRQTSWMSRPRCDLSIFATTVVVREFHLFILSQSLDGFSL